MRRILPWILGGLLIACSSIRTSHDYDPRAEFRALRTYAWAEADPERLPDPLTQDRVMRATDDELAAKGFQIDAADPDFLVAAHLAVETKLRITETAYGYYRRPPLVWNRHVYLDEYEVGTLVLDVIETASESLVWRGTATGSLLPSTTPERREARIREAVRELLAPFPPDGAR